MKKFNKINTFLATSLLLAAALPAAADDDSGLYISTSVNRLSVDFKDQDDVQFDDSDNAAGLRVGYMLTDMVGFELGYLDLGNYAAKSDTAGNQISLDAKAFTGAVVLNWELLEGLDLYGRAGAFYIEADSDSVIGGRSFQSKEDGTEAFGAIGLEADLGYWNIFGELSTVKTDINDLNVNIATVGIKYEFGR